MKRRAFLAASLTSLAILVSTAPPVQAAGGSNDPFAYVPADAATVGQVRFADLKSNPLGARLFREADQVTVDGDAARFLEETRLRPTEDVDVLTVAFRSNTNGSNGEALAIFEGRFDPAKLEAALLARGGRKVTTPAGDYVILPKGKDGKESDGAVALVSRQLVVAGNTEAVGKALARQGGSEASFRDSRGLARHMGRIESGASAWALVDANRYQSAKKAMESRAHDGDSRHGDSNVVALMGAMKSVSLIAFSATAKGDAIKLGVEGLVEDEETRELMEDAMRGIMAAWRLAAQEKSPEIVQVLRKFKVERDNQGVSIRGTLPGAAVRAMAEKVDEKRASK